MRERLRAFRWGPVRWLATAGALFGGLLIAACAGGDDGARPGDDATPTVTEVAEAPTTTTTTAATTTTTTTTTAPVVVSTTTSTSTTVAEPTMEEIEAEIAAAYDEVYWGYWACLRSPLDCDVSWLAPDSGSSRAMQATMEALAERDRFVGDEDVGYYVIESIEIADNGVEATVVTCWWSTAVLYTSPADPSRPAGPDNPPTIVNNTPGSSRQLDLLVRSNTSWQVQSSQGLESFDEEDVCED